MSGTMSGGWGGPYLEDTQGHWGSAQCALKVHLVEAETGFSGAKINYKGFH